MSATGQQRTCRAEIAMSALPPKADIRPRDQDVCFGPIAIGTAQATPGWADAPQRNCARPTAMRPAITAATAISKVHLK
jgi:hypothetical protein